MASPAAPQSAIQPRAMALLKQFSREIGVGYSTVVFLAQPLLGCFLLAATFLQPNIAACGLIGSVLTLLLLEAMSLKTYPFRRMALYNGLLVGLFIGYLFKLDGLVLVLLAIASALCLTFTAVTDSILRGQGLPTLSIPFTLSAIAISLARPHLSNLTDATPYFIAHALPWTQGLSLPDPVVEFLRSMGCIFCMPDPLFGTLMFGLLAATSPMLGMLFAAGFSVGYGWEQWVRINTTDLHFTHYFNYSLTYAALALVFLAPSRKSFVLGFLATLLSSLVAMSSMTYWEIFRIPIVPFAFNVTVLLVLRATYWLLPGQLATLYAGSPEATVDRARLFRIRQHQGEIGVFCPFDGVWQVQQGFDGKWTHKGNWKHALDFVVQGEDKKTYRGQGLETEDYHCFGQPVLSPMDGHVAKVCSTLPDNAIGKVDNENNWGNYIVIRSAAGYFVVLAHLKKDSVKVKPGDFVIAGTTLAHCGNSGYSQEPHLHMQVQWSDAVGGFTSPFHLLNYKSQNRLHFRKLPSAGDLIEPFPLNRALDRALGFRIGEKLLFVNSGERRSEAATLEFEVRLDELSGALYLTDGSSKLYFGRLGAQHYFYGFEGNRRSALAHLLAAAPRIPLIYGDDVEFTDALPASLENSAYRRWKVLFSELAGLSSTEDLPRYSMRPNQLEITGNGNRTRIKLDPSLGILEFGAKGHMYERKV